MSPFVMRVGGNDLSLEQTIALTNGSALMTAVGLAVVREISRPAFLAGVIASGQYLEAKLNALSRELDLGEVRGKGLLLAMELNRPNAAEVVAAALASGLLINAPRPSILRFMPALNVTREDIDRMIAMLRNAIRN